MSAPRYLLSLIACLVVSIGGSTTAGATSRTDAIRLYRRIAGVPPTPAQVTQMAQLLDSGNVEEAARIPLDTDEFINNGAKRMVVPWTDVLGSSQKSIHFSTALMLGLIRDDLPFDQVLYGDSFYVGSAAISSTETTSRVLGRPYITNSGHFANLDNNHLSEPTNPYLLNPDNYDDTYVPDLKQRIFTNLFLVKVPQDGFMTPSYEHYRETAWALQPPYAGIMTAPDFAQAFYSAGTNRRPIKFLMQNFLCKTLEQLMDVNLPDTFVRRRPKSRRRQSYVQAALHRLPLGDRRNHRCVRLLRREPRRRSHRGHPFLRRSPVLPGLSADPHSRQDESELHELPGGPRRDGLLVGEPLGGPEVRRARLARCDEWHGDQRARTDAGAVGGVRELHGYARVRARLPSRAR